MFETIRISTQFLYQKVHVSRKRFESIGICTHHFLHMKKTLAKNTKFRKKTYFKRIRLSKKFELEQP